MKGRLAAAAVGAALALSMPAAASAADPAIDAARAAYDDLGITQLPGMPSGRTTYRSYEEYNADMAALAAANPDLVAVKTAPYRSVEGRRIRYVEITNHVDAPDGKPVFLDMGAIHGDETAAAEDSLEFAYDVVSLSKTNPKVKALLDKVRLIVLPVVNVDGLVRNRRTSCGGPGIVPPPTCSPVGTDADRNYPFGWGSDLGVIPAARRGSGPGSEPEVKNTMDIVQSHQVVLLITQHTNSRALLYPGLDTFAGFPPDKRLYDELGAALNSAAGTWTTTIKDSAHDYETSGETIDWSYYATRAISYTLELVGADAGCPQARPDYLNCTTADFTGTPGPASSAAQTARFNGKPARNILWQALVYASLPSGHGVIEGTALPGATLRLTKDFNLYTATITSDTTSPPRAIPTHLESSIVVPASGRFTWDVNPSLRPVPAFEAAREVPGPRGFLPESYTITCTAADGRLLSTSKVLVDRGDVAHLSLCTPGTVSVPPTLSLTLRASQM